MKIRIAIATYSGLTAHCKTSLEKLVATDIAEWEVCEDRHGDSVPYRILEGCPVIGQARNSLVKAVGDWDAILFIDDDIGFEPADVLRLINSGFPIVSCAYEYRNTVEGCYVAGYWGDSQGHSPINKRVQTTTTGLHRVDWIPMGMTLIYRSVFNEMEYPWFRHGLVAIDGKKHEYSEDFGFCIGAAKAGFDIWLDCDGNLIHRKGEIMQPTESANSGARGNANTDLRDWSLKALGYLSRLTQEVHYVSAEMATALSLVAELQTKNTTLEARLAELKGENDSLKAQLAGKTE